MLPSLGLVIKICSCVQKSTVSTNYNVNNTENENEKSLIFWPGSTTQFINLVNRVAEKMSPSKLHGLKYKFTITHPQMKTKVMDLKGHKLETGLTHGTCMKLATLPTSRRCAARDVVGQ